MDGYMTTPYYDGRRAAAKWGRTPEIQRNAQAKVDEVMTDRFVARIRDYARRDAKTGDYMTPGFVQMQKDYMREHVSPDRSGPIAQTTALLQEAAKDDDPLLELIDKLLGQCSVKAHVSPGAQTAEIYSPEGEMIAGYNSLGSGWTIVQTKAENKFLSEVATVYAQAFKEARAEMKAAAQGQVPQGDAPNIDIKA